MRRTKARIGDWRAICDRCGRNTHASMLRREWEGFMVCSSCYNPKHEQLELRGVPEEQSLPFTRTRPEPIYREEGTDTSGDF